MLAGRVRRDHRFDGSLSEPPAQLGSVVGAIRDEAPGGADAVQECGSARQLVGVAGRYDERARPAALVDKGVELGGASTAGGADGMGKGPPFAPAAERCALA